ncbi:response regulator transcription factor [uncultured Tessaracoccus sp.]|uniref:response regulator transcription factor n=1 Tax=uncultured Tessaracoccus sp. TaxID=905023 RepID=UPI0025D2BCA5|nr:response regulator transcription factor [uncultured Tessaracoccus sp.]
MIRVGLCDDDALVRQLLAETLTQGDIEVVVTCASGEEALADRTPVDLWLVDLRMPGMDGRETARRLTAADPGLRVIILTAFGDERITATLRAGASAYLHKDATPAQLSDAIRAVMGGFTVVAPGALDEVLRQPAGEGLLDEVGADDVDRRIVQLMSAGYSYDQMAADVDMSVSGTKKRAARLMTALEVRSRSQLVAKVNGFEA